MLAVTVAARSNPAKSGQCAPIPKAISADAVKVSATSNVVGWVERFARPNASERAAMLGLAHSASKMRVNALVALDPTYGLRASRCTASRDTRPLELAPWGRSPAKNNGYDVKIFVAFVRESSTFGPILAREGPFLEGCADEKCFWCHRVLGAAQHERSSAGAPATHKRVEDARETR